MCHSHQWIEEHRAGRHSGCLSVALDCVHRYLLTHDQDTAGLEDAMEALGLTPIEIEAACSILIAPDPYHRNPALEPQRESARRKRSPTAVTTARRRKMFARPVAA